MSQSQIEIKNCNNLDAAVITLAKGKLNIKFAPNGTGKSTIARAVLLGAKGDQSLLSELMPFRLRKANPENKRPEVKGAETLKNIMCFNEEYVSQFLFKPEELLSNSFDIFIKTKVYIQRTPSRHRADRTPIATSLECHFSKPAIVSDLSQSDKTTRYKNLLYKTDPQHPANSG